MKIKTYKMKAKNIPLANKWDYCVHSGSGLVSLDVVDKNFSSQVLIKGRDQRGKFRQIWFDREETVKLAEISDVNTKTYKYWDAT